MSAVGAEDLYSTLVELGEVVEFPDFGVRQFASFVPNRLNKAIATTDGAYWFNGNMTFDSVEQQEKLTGAYFKRAAEPGVTLILYGAFPNTYTQKIGDVHCVECNEKIDIVSYEEKTEETNELGEPIYRPVYAFKDVDAYITAFTKEARQMGPSSLDETITYLTVPAKFMISEKNKIMIPGIVFDEEEKRNKIAKVPYQVEGVDTTMADYGEDCISGTIKCQLKRSQER